MPSTSEPASRAAASPPLIAVDGLTVLRDTSVILDHVSWTMHPGEHWTLLGANGSGKTSLLMALAGYLMPTAGRITVLGRTFGETDWRDLRREIGIVSSSLRQRIDDGESAREIVASGKYAMLNFWGTLTRADKRSGQEWLDRVGCGALARRPWAVLSQGERQRVLIARALVAAPRLLILDEPCAGLDPVAREHFLAFIDSMAKSGDAPGLVLVTHHVEEITPGFTHALLLCAGKVVAQGTRRRTLTSPLLGAVFGEPVKVRHRNGRLRLSFPHPTKGGIV